MEQGLKALYMGLAAVLFAAALWILFQLHGRMLNIHQEITRNQHSAEVIRIG